MCMQEENIHVQGLSVLTSEMSLEFGVERKTDVTVKAHYSLLKMFPHPKKLG